MSHPVSKVARKRRRLGWRVILLCVAAVGISLSGCSSIGYYRQAAAGQYEILSKQRKIETVINDRSTDDKLREKLRLVMSMREFAERELGLKTDGHYASYADLGRPYVVWNVYAAPEFSLEPKRWWYPVVGSLKYRGFFSEKAAREYGEELKKQGYDVHVGGVDAYSTLGWLKDPVLNTFLRHNPTEVAETLFHELAHQRVFASGDTDFNEAFATAVGEEGVRRWLEKRGDAKARADYEADLQRKDQFVALVMSTREELRKVYGPDGAGSPGPGNRELTAVKRAQKAAVIAKMRADYELLKASWGGYAGYDNWFKRSINNAQLGTVAAYYHFVPAFKELLAQNQGDLQKFYASARSMTSLTKEQRHERMASLLKPIGAIASVPTQPSDDLAGPTTVAEAATEPVVTQQ